MTPYPGGHPPPPMPHPAQPRPPQRANWLGTSAFAAAIGGLILCWSVVGGVLCGVLALVFGVVGRRRARDGAANNGPVAAAGAALGLVAVVVSLAIVPVWVRVFRDVDVPAYADCVARTSDRGGVEKCVDELRQRVNAELGAKDAPAG